jgi:hypothetical protein
MSHRSIFQGTTAPLTGPLVTFTPAGGGLIGRADNGDVWRIPAAEVKRAGGYRSAILRWTKYRPSVAGVTFVEAHLLAR